MHDDALADGITGFRVVLDEVVIDRVDVAMAEDRPGDLRHGLLDGEQRLPG